MVPPLPPNPTMQLQLVPAPAPASAPLRNPIIVLGPQFVAPYPIELVIRKKLTTFKDGEFTVTDANGNVIFTVRGSVFSVHDQRVLLDVIGIPVLTLRQKVLTSRKRWLVYRGESSDKRNLLFAVRKVSMFHLKKTRLDVFLPENAAEEFPDFHIEGSFSESGCTVFVGNSSAVIAQMHRHHNIQSISDKDTYGVTVSPHVDFAFVTALIVVLHEINVDKSGDGDY